MTLFPPSRGRRAGASRTLTTADLVVLSLLAEQPMHGWELLAEYKRQEVADWASVSKAQLYYALRKMDELGLIAGRSEAGMSGERTVFAPTRSGMRALAAALADPAWAHARVAQPFSTWLGLSMHAEPEARQALLRARESFLKAEIGKERESLAYIETLSGERAALGGDIVRLVIRQLEVELDWIGGLLRSSGRRRKNREA